MHSLRNEFQILEVISMDSQEIAEKSSKVMWENDAASKWFGMRIENIGPGYAELVLNIEKHHCNGHVNCH